MSAQRRESATRSSESETFVSGRSLLEVSMKSIHFGSNVENRPFGAPKLALAQTHNMKSTPFSATRRIGHLELQSEILRICKRLYDGRNSALVQPGQVLKLLCARII